MRRALAVLSSAALVLAQVPAAWANRVVPGKLPGGQGAGQAPAVVRLQSLVAPLSPAAPVPASQPMALSRVPAAAPLSPASAAVELPAALPAEAARILADPAVGVFLRRVGEIARRQGGATAGGAPAEGVEVERLVPALVRVRELVAGMAPERLEARSDDDIAALVSSIFEGEAPESLPVTPETVTGFLREVAPAVQAELNAALELDPSRPETCAACGPASLGSREHLEALLEERFPGEGLKVRLVPGRLDGEGEPVPHVLLEVYQPDPASSLFIKQRLAVYDPSAAQKPGNMRAMGLEPGEPAVFAWEAGLYGRYGFVPQHPADGVQTLKKIEGSLLQYGSRTRGLIESFARRRSAGPTSSSAAVPR